MSGEIEDVVIDNRLKKWYKGSMKTRYRARAAGDSWEVYRLDTKVVVMRGLPNQKLAKEVASKLTMAFQNGYIYRGMEPFISGE
jgi:hypothetical protein